MATTTPWGKADTATRIARGIMEYTTPSHGGFHLSPTRLKEMPECLLRQGTWLGKPDWFEEDQDYALVILAFPQYFTTARINSALETHSYAKWDFTRDEYFQTKPGKHVAERLRLQKTTAVSSSTPGTYSACPAPAPQVPETPAPEPPAQAPAPVLASDLSDDVILDMAKEILKRRLVKEHACVVTSPDIARDFLIHHLALQPYETFSVLMLDNKHCVLSFETLFRGTFDGTSVYPREVVVECLKKNTAAVIFAHNHPSGNPEPSLADDRITEKLKAALELVGIRVLDHLIIGGSEIYSFAEHGKL